MARGKWIFGAQQSAAQGDPKPGIAQVGPSADARKFGLENFGNTCYANSVIQALYFCTPFRDLMIQERDPSAPPTPRLPLSPSPPPLPFAPVRRKPERKASVSGTAPADGTPPQSHGTLNAMSPVYTIPPNPPTLFSALRSLFLHISTNPVEKGTVAPRAFIDKLKEVNELFRSTMHQDAHEFLNYLLNKIVEEVEQARTHTAEDLSNSVATLAPTVLSNSGSTNSGTPPEDATLVHRLFEGVLTSETRCLTCETVSSRDECFLDLSIDIEENSSVTACLRQFSASEMLCQKNKFFCDSCCDLQEAEKRMKIKKLPNVLALHLKRFKYQEDAQKYVKLAYRVAFPFELRLFNTVDDMDEPDRLFNLFAIVVHIGAGPHHGHYISIIKTLGIWLVFDDDNVYPITEAEIPKYYGDSSSGSAYVLYYQAADINLEALGIQRRTPSPISTPISRFNSTSDIPSSSPNATPALPPGLIESSESDVSDPSFPLTPVQSQAPIPIHVKPRLAPVDITIPPPHEGPPASPVTPTRPSTSKGKGLFSTLRRAPSNQARPSTSTGVVRRASLGDAAISISRAQAPPMSPAHENAHEDDGDEDETVDSHALDSQTGALPTLPMVDTSVNSARQPQSPKRENGKYKESDKEPTRKSSTWFGKRRSGKFNEKEKRPETAFATLPGSDGPQSPSGWFRNTAPRERTKVHRPAEGLMDDSAFAALATGKRHSKSPVDITHIDHRSGEPFGSSAMRSATSSAGSLSGQHSLSSGSSQRERERHHASPPAYAPPPRMSSLISPPASPQSPSRTVHKQSLSNLKPSRHKDKTKGPPPVDTPRRPATAGGGSSKLDRPLPPVPPLPHARTHINGHSFPDDLVLDIRAASSETARSQDAFVSPAGLATSYASMGGASTTSTTTTSSAGSGFKRATRKLSLTAPLRNLGRKKYKEEAGPPSAYPR